MKYRNHDGEHVSECDNYDDYPHLKAGCATGPFDELDRAEEMRERGRRVMAGLRATKLTTICAWCKWLLVLGKWREDTSAGEWPVGSVSHGMCPDCYDKNFEEIEQPQGGTGK